MWVLTEDTLTIAPAEVHTGGNKHIADRKAVFQYVDYLYAVESTASKGATNPDRRRRYKGRLVAEAAAQTDPELSVSLLRELAVTVTMRAVSQKPHNEEVLTLDEFQALMQVGTVYTSVPHPHGHWPLQELSGNQYCVLHSFLLQTSKKFVCMKLSLEHTVHLR